MKKKLPSLSIAFSAVMIIGLILPLRADTDRVIWSGRSGGFDIRWSLYDIIFSSTSSPDGGTLSVSSISKKNHAQEIAWVKKEFGKDNRLVDYQRDFSILSVVGSIVTIEEHFFASLALEAHPWGESRFTTLDLSRPGGINYRNVSQDLNINLSKPGKVAKLTDYFNESDILKGLLADPVIKEFIKNTGLNPRTLKALVKSMSGQFMISERYCCSMADDLLTRFAFHHIEGDRVAVKIGISGAGPCRESNTRIGLLLPIPESLRNALKLAEVKEEGFLMKDLKMVSGDRKTKFRY